MKRLKLLWQIIRTTDADKILIGFVGFVLFTAFLFMMVEPTIHTYGDAIWYAFAVFTTIGFGDVVATTPIGRVMTMLLGLYGILVVAIMSSTIVNYYIEMSKVKANDSVAKFIDKLERLPELSEDELKEISKAVRHKKFKL